jgi:hypothetical protein
MRVKLYAIALIIFAIRIVFRSNYDEIITIELIKCDPSRLFFFIFLSIFDIEYIIVLWNYILFYVMILSIYHVQK